jgi:hypothetical protein
MLLSITCGLLLTIIHKKIWRVTRNGRKGLPKVVYADKAW